MDSWTTLLFLDVARGRLVVKGQATPEHWRRLWLLVHEAYPEAMLAYLVVGG